LIQLFTISKKLSKQVFKLVILIFVLKFSLSYLIQKENDVKILLAPKKAKDSVYIIDKFNPLKPKFLFKALGPVFMNNMITVYCNNYLKNKSFYHCYNLKTMQDIVLFPNYSILEYNYFINKKDSFFVLDIGDETALLNLCILDKKLKKRVCLKVFSNDKIEDVKVQNVDDFYIAFPIECENQKIYQLLQVIDFKAKKLLTVDTITYKKKNFGYDFDYLNWINDTVFEYIKYENNLNVYIYNYNVKSKLKTLQKKIINTKFINAKYRKVKDTEYLIYNSNVYTIANNGKFIKSIEKNNFQIMDMR